MAHRTLWFSSDDMSEKISSGTKKKPRTNKKVKTNVKQSVLFRKLKSSNLGPVVQIYTTYSDMGFFSHEKLVLFDIIIPQKSFSFIRLLWINELFITFPGKIKY